MKSNILITVIASLVAISSFAQKNELKAADKALRKGNPEEAKSILMSSEAIMKNADDDQKAEYYFLRGNATLELANKDVAKSLNTMEAAKAYQSLVELEKKSGKDKYTKDSKISIEDVKAKLVNSAVEDQGNKKFKEGQEKLYMAYKLDESNPINLYYAASFAVNDKNYDKALEYYYELKNMKYSGEGTNFFAVDKISNAEVTFATAEDRDRFVKLGSHEKPRDEKIPSKRGEIFTNIALILVEQGKTDEAQKALREAREANPEDVSLIVSEANLYLNKGDMENYKKVILEAVSKNPNDPDMFYNLGVVSASAKDNKAAEEYYNKAIALDPKYKNAYLNLAILKLDADTKLVEQMNALGASAKDNKRYEELKVERSIIFKSVLPSLEKVVELDPNNNEAKKTLLNVYTSLEMQDKYKALKATMD